MEYSAGSIWTDSKGWDLQEILKENQMKAYSEFILQKFQGYDWISCLK